MDHHWSRGKGPISAVQRWSFVNLQMMAVKTIIKVKKLAKEGVVGLLIELPKIVLVWDIHHKLYGRGYQCPISVKAL